MLFILVLALLLFGPKKIPEVARKIAQFKNLTNDLKSRLETEFQQLESETQEAIPGTGSLREAIEPFTHLRDELKAVVSFDSEPPSQPQINTASGEKNANNPQ